MGHRSIQMSWRHTKNDMDETDASDDRPFFMRISLSSHSVLSSSQMSRKFVFKYVHFARTNRNFPRRTNCSNQWTDEQYLFYKLLNCSTVMNATWHEREREGEECERVETIAYCSTTVNDIIICWAFILLLFSLPLQFFFHFCCCLFIVWIDWRRCQERPF